MEESYKRILEHYKAGEGNLVSLLQDIQKEFGYIPEKTVDWFSRSLGIPASRFFGIVTFYSQFHLKPRGKNIVTACCGTACHVRGAEKIASGIQRELKLPPGQDTTDDGSITFERVACLGTCSFAPVVLINGDVNGKATLDVITKKVKALRKH